METQESPDDLFNAKQAAEYLQKKWGVPKFTVEAFRQYRFRHEIKQRDKSKLPNSSQWQRRDLDAMPPLDTTKRRKVSEERGGLDSDVNAVLSFA